MLGHLLRQAEEGSEGRAEVLDLLEFYEGKGQQLTHAFRKGFSTLAMARVSMDSTCSVSGMVSWQKILVDDICLNIDNPGCGIGQPVKLRLNLKDKDSFDTSPQD